MEKKDKTLSIRLNAADLEKIQSNAAAFGLSVSDYVRAMAIYQSVIQIIDGAAVARELAHIGRNLNQITKNANYNHSIDSGQINAALQQWEKIRRIIIQYLAEFPDYNHDKENSADAYACI